MAMTLEGGERLVLKTLLDLQGNSNAYVDDTELAVATRMTIEDVRNWLETLGEKGLVERTRLSGGFSAYVVAEGKLALRMTEPILVAVAATSRPGAPSEAESGSAIDSSGNWIMLGGRFVEAKRVKQRGGVVRLAIHSRTADDDAAMHGLGSARRGDGAIAYAYRNDAFIMNVQDVESESSSEGLDWIITLKPNNIEYGRRPTEMATKVNGKHYSPDNIAELRASRILLNDPPPMARDPRRFDEQSLLERLIRGTNVYLPADRCIVRDLYVQYGDAPALYLPIARLGAIYALKAEDVIETVEKLTLGLIEDNGVHDKFAGKRRSIYSNKAAYAIEIEGDCPLT